MRSAEVFGRTIVVGVDGSTHAERAALWAADQARRDRRCLVVLGTGVDGNAHVVAQLVEKARTSQPGVTVVGRHMDAPPRRALVEASHWAGLIVLGSRGRGPGRSKLLGSVSAAVSRYANSPVVVCRPHHPGLIRDGVVVGADLTAPSRPVLDFAFRHASSRGLPLTVVYCSEYTTRPLEAEGIERAMAEALAGLGTTYPDVHVTRRIARGFVDVCLTRHTRPWDLIVVGRHELPGPARWLGATTATTVLEQADSPVAVVPVLARARVAETHPATTIVDV